MAGCGGGTQAPEPIAPPDAAPIWPSEHRVTWVDLSAEGADVDAAERLATAEWAVLRSPWAIPRVRGLVPAGFERALDDGATSWRLELGDVGVRLCGAWAGCEEVGTLDAALERMGLGPPGSPLLLGRGDLRDAATLYGLRRPGRRARGEGSAGALWIRARRQLAGGAPGRAAAQLQRALARDPEPIALHAALGASLAAAGRVDEASRAWRRAARLSPQDPRLEVSVAAAELASGDIASAEARISALPARPRALPPVVALRSAPESSPSTAGLSTAPARPVRGAAALRAQRPSPQEILEALAGSRDPLAAVLRGRAHMDLRRPRRALAEADRALAEAPWLPEALALRAAALDAQGLRTLAAAARADLRHADPGSAAGPRRLLNAREIGEAAAAAEREAARQVALEARLRAERAARLQEEQDR